MGKEEDKKKLNEALREEFENREVSVMALSKVMKTSNSNLYNWANRRENSDKGELGLRPICKALGINYVEFYAKTLL